MYQKMTRNCWPIEMNTILYIKKMTKRLEEGRVVEEARSGRGSGHKKAIKLVIFLICLQIELALSVQFF